MSEHFVIDAHTHLGAISGFQPYYHAPEHLLRLMDKTNTELAIFSHMGLLTAQFELGYAESKAIYDKYPDRFRFYGIFDPHWPDLSLELLQLYEAHPGFVGVKIHPTGHAVAPDDVRYAPFWELANARAWVVLTHSWSVDWAKPTQNLSVPDLFERVLEAHSQVRLLLGHCGGRREGRQMAIRLMRRFENCWADLSGDSFPCGELEWLSQHVAPERLLYGTDATWIEPRYVFAQVLNAHLPQEQRLRIFRQNALALFGAALNLQ